mgnify:FL=1
MITKIQKIWLWIFGAMFLIPEILWSPISNFLYIIWKGGNMPFILRNNFLMHSDYRKLLLIIIFIQVIGALLSAIFIYKSKNNLIIKLILVFLSSLFFILSSLIFIFLLLTVNISFP